MENAFDLRRFVETQDPVWLRVRGELAAGAKTSHWMWFVFPQLRGLGHSATALRYGLASGDEAHAYWRHRLLGARLKEGSQLVLAVAGRSALQIFGPLDDLKFRSCMTLFEAVAPDEPVFARVLEKYFGGERDARTLELLR